jgi:dTDP-4-amino-4,6-dideoxygalactose transaminase
VDLAAERAELGEALPQALLRVLESGQYVLGPEVEKFERDFARLCRVPHAIAVASGTDALVLALRAAGIRPGDTVVTSPFTFFASAAAIAWIGGVPRLADVEAETGLLDPRGAARAIDERTRALLPVHLYGQLADVRAFRELADAHRLALIEDGAQAHGAERDGFACGELGDAGCFSFYPTKNLAAAGEGGLVVTRDGALAERLRLLRDHGCSAKYQHAVLGTNSRMQAFQAAVLNTKLPHLAAWNARRAELARLYDEGLAGHPAIRPLARVPGAVHVHHQYAVRVHGPSRDALLAGLRERGIHAAVHYPTPVHLQPAAAAWGYGPGDFPVAEALAREVLCLPIHPFLADGDARRVIDALDELAR